MSHNTNTVSLSLVALTFASAVAASTAMADVVEYHVGQTTEPAGNHCVVELSPVANGAKSSAAIDLGCYESFSEAIEAATEGEVLLPHWATPESVTEEDFADSKATYLIGIDYDSAWYGGRSVTWTTTNPRGCFRGTTYRANMPARMNNRLSSTRSFSGCAKNYSYDLYYQNPFGSWVWGYWNYSLRYHPMNNRTSSKKWTR